MQHTSAWADQGDYIVLDTFYGSKPILHLDVLLRKI